MTILNHLRRAAIATAVVATVAVAVASAGAADADMSGQVSATTPARPRSLKATPRSTKVTLTWSAPSSNGGATVNRYAVQRSRTGTSRWRTLGFPKRTRFTATGLRNGVRYYFRVRAHNAAGWGPSSTKVSATPRSKPSAPRAPATTLGDGTVKLRWRAPASTGGAPIVKYVVQRSMTSGRPWANLAYPTIRGYTAKGLSMGTTYYFRVRARNAAGWGPASVVVHATPSHVPDAPLWPEALPSAGTILVQWSTPPSDTPVNEYKTQRATDPSGPWGNVVYESNRYHYWDGLTNGTRYYFRVAAHNAAGWGPYATVDAVPGNTPTAPRSLFAVAGGQPRSVNLTWQNPQFDGGAQIDTYEVQMAPGAPVFWTTVDTTAGKGYTVPGLAPGMTYYFRIAAHNANGLGQWSAEVPYHVPAEPAGAPKACTAIQLYGAGYDTAYIDWDAPASDGGSPVINYHINVWTWNYSALVTSTDTVGNFTDQHLTVPLSKSVYQFQVYAKTAVGNGLPCASILSMSP